MRSRNKEKWPAQQRSCRSKETKRISVSLHISLCCQHSFPLPPFLSPFNFPEDGGACEPGTWHWFPSALGNNLRAVTRATSIYLCTFLHIPPPPPLPPVYLFYFFIAAAQRATGRQMLSGGGAIGRDWGAAWGRVCVHVRDGWPCQARAGRALHTLAWTVGVRACVLWGRVNDICTLKGWEGGKRKEQ